MRKGEEKLQSIYNYIQQFIDDNGFPPSVREIAAKVNLKSTSNVHYYLERLKSAGLIAYEENKKRAIVVNGKNRSQANFVPLVGKVSAGTGILAQENIEGEFPLPQSLFVGNDIYMLRVQGDSMINAGIFDGDFVVVRQQSDVESGEIAVVLWQGQATIKRLKAFSPNLILHPENDAMDDIVIPPEDNPGIIGKVIGCIKKF